MSLKIIRPWKIFFKVENHWETFKNNTVTSSGSQSCVLKFNRISGRTVCCVNSLKVLMKLQKKGSSIKRNFFCVPLLVFIKNFGHGEGNFGNFLILGVGAHVAPCDSYPVLLCADLVVRHRLPLLHRRVLLLFIWKSQTKSLNSTLCSPCVTQNLKVLLTFTFEVYN